MERSKSKIRRCAIYTRKSSEEGLEQEFNSLQAQREACEAFIKSQAAEGWRLVRTHYDDGGLSGATMERPALQRLMADIAKGLEAAILSRMRSPVTSRSNCANESKTFSVRRPIEVAVLNCWVTATNETPWASKTSTILAKSASERVSRSTL
jgi:Resolvase, N terminal domain